MKKIFKAITAITMAASMIVATAVNASASSSTIETPVNGHLKIEPRNRANYYNVTECTEKEKVLKHLNPSWTDVQKVAYIYSWITNQATHIDNVGKGIVFGGSGQCSTYAGTFERIAIAAGLDVHMVGGSGHAWNLVKIDGIWYIFDCDTGSTNSAMYIAGSDYRKWLANYTEKEKYTDVTYIAESSPYIQKRTDYATVCPNGCIENGCFFEYKGQWYYGSRCGVFTIDSSLKVSTMKMKYSFKDIKVISNSCVFNYDNGRYYFNTSYRDGTYGSVYEYNVSTNSVKKIYTDNSESRMVWLGIDKYALYFVRDDGTWGTVSLAGDDKKLELSNENDITIKVGEYVFSTPMASTMYKCGPQVKAEVSNKEVLTDDFPDQAKTLIGAFQALAPGKCKVTVSAYGRKASYNVTVVPDSSSVLEDDNVDGYFYLSISPGESRILPATKFFGKLPSELKTFGRINRFNMEKQNMSLNIPLLYFDLSELDPNYEKMKNDPNSCTVKVTQDGSPAITGIFNGSQITYLGTCRFEAYLDGKKKTVRIILVPKGTKLLNGETKLYVPVNKNSSASSDVSGNVLTAKIMSGAALTLDKGSKVDVSYLFNYAGDISKINFKSSDDSVASIITSGGKKYIKGNKTGTATISAKVNGMTSYIEVNIISSSKKTSSLSLSSDIYFGKNTVDSTLTAKLSSGSTDKVTWVISDNNSLVFKNVNSSGTKVNIARPNRINRNTGTVKVYAIASNGTVKSINVDVGR